MRSKYKSWQDKRSGWSRRVIWYEGDPNDIRLKFEDPDGVQNRFYNNKDDAQRDYDCFRRGQLTVAEIAIARFRGPALCVTPNVHEAVCVSCRRPFRPIPDIALKCPYCKD
jgi:hypothetical protein